MRLAAYLPLTLCDYPGKIAAMVFTQGCNLRCSWCHNAHLIPRAGSTPPLDTDSVIETLADRRRRGLIDGLVVSGGEPTLHPTLPAFLDRCRAVGLAIKLDTNGTHPEPLERCLQSRVLDFVAMDVKAPWDRYEALTGVPADVSALRESVRLIAASGLPHQFRTTRVPGLLADADCTAIRGQIPADSPHVWQSFRPPPDNAASP